jgi:TonB family protein
VILSSGYEVSVRGTHFVVFTIEGGIGVDLSEGVVEVRAPDGTTLELRAPVRWRSDGGELGELEAAPHAVGPRAIAAGASAWPVLRVSHPDIVRWNVDGTRVGVAGPLALRVEPGERRVEGWDARDRLFSALVLVGTQDTALSEGELVAEAPRARPGHLAPEEISPVIARSSVALRQCYERSLRQGPDIEGTLSLRITVGMVGDVQRVQVVGAPAESTAQLRECVVQIAEHWSFPPPGGPVTFQLPVRFTQRGPQ